MSINYLEALPLSEIIRYTGESPKNGFSFVGYPRQHPYDKNKLVFVYDPLGENTALMEFKIEDIIGVEELHSAVTTSGDTTPLMKLWVRKGAKGVMLEPFEVDEPLRFIYKKANNFIDHFFIENTPHSEEKHPN